MGHATFAPWRASFTCLLLLTLAAVSRGDEGMPSLVSEESVYETDRPGELENPFTVPPGGAELVGYVVEMNAAAREDAFGTGGSAVIMDTAVRFGVADRIEGMVAVDGFLIANSTQGGASGSDTGFGYSTLLVKWNFWRDGMRDFGLAIAPFVRLPLNPAIGGTSRSEAGLIVPFDVDLEGGWELEGSTSVTRVPGDAENWSTKWES
jgi:hypothetical protein